VRNIVGVVSSAYKRGLRWGVAEVNPVEASEPPIPKKKEGIALTVEQQEELIAAAKAPWGTDVFLELDAAIGARRGELLGLQWSGLQGQQLMIGRSLSQVGQQVFLKEPKNKKFRVVTIPSSALKKLQAHRKTQRGIPRPLRRELPGRLHILQSGRLAPEAGHGPGLRLAPVPQPQASEGREPPHPAPYARLAPARGGRAAHRREQARRACEPARHGDRLRARAAGRDDLAAAAWEKFQQQNGQPAKKAHKPQKAGRPGPRLRKASAR
jgi:hypothetical protein